MSSLALEWIPEGGRRRIGRLMRTWQVSSLALEWIPEGGRRRIGRLMRTWQDMLKEDSEIMAAHWGDARDTASDRARWRQLIARCSTWNGRN